MEKKQIGEILSVSLPLLGLLAISFLGFSNKIRKQATEQQEGICPVCGEKLHGYIEGHHRVPKSKGGNNSLKNCVMVHGDPYGKDCHESIDRKAIEKGLIFLSSEFPEVPILEVPNSMKAQSFSRKVGHIYKRGRSHKHNRHGR